MRIVYLSLLAAAAPFAAVTATAPIAATRPVTPVPPAIAAAVADAHRTPANLPRDVYRHPAQTLAFFGVKPTDHLVEFIPGGGWYTEILGPLVAAKGSYTALVTSAKGAEGATKLLADKHIAGNIATVDPATGATGIAAGSTDVVLTFRNVHNLIMDGDQAAANVFKAWFTMLKPGGTLGIEDHRLPESADASREKTSGYLKQSTIIALAQAAGFMLSGQSEINANPKDTTDWPEGVWTLPPTYRLGDVDRAKYQAIGESDRMTLRFVKPPRTS